MSWNSERVATLKKLWLEGQSATQIANELGGVTRNAVIGKVHRLGLTGRATPSLPKPQASPPRPDAEVVSLAVRKRQQQRQVTRPPPRSPQAPAPAPMPLASAGSTLRPMVAEEGPITVLTLGADMCKWPIGDPTSDTFQFCGHRTEGRAAYCASHAQVSRQEATGRKPATANELARSLRRYL